MKQLIAEGNKEELQKCFGARMEFGTAGLRAAMGAGVARMNDLTIIQTTQVTTFLYVLVILTIPPVSKGKWRYNEHFKVYLSKNLLKSGTIQLLEMVRSLHWLELGDLLIEKRQKQSKEMNRLAVAQAITLFGKASEAICGQLSFSFYFFFLFVVICFWQTAVQFLFHNYELNSAIQLDGEGVRQSHSFCSSGFDFLTWVIYKLTFWIA